MTEKSKPKVTKGETNGKTTTQTYKAGEAKVLKGKTEGDYHYYAPRKVVVKHDVSQLEAVQPILDIINSGKFWKIRAWTVEGIHSCKTFKGKASLTVVKRAPVKPKIIKKVVAGTVPVGKTPVAVTA